MYQYRQVLVRMRQGDSDREIERSGVMGRKKVAQIRAIAKAQQWLSSEQDLPDDATLADVFGQTHRVPNHCVSSVTPWREQITQWHAAGIIGTTIHATLVRNHGYKGSYASVNRFLLQLVDGQDIDVPLRLDFKPGEAAQVDFGAGPLMTDVHTGEVFKTWFFVMTLCWSRHQYAVFVQNQSVSTWLSCHRHAFEWFGGVPGRIIIDNPKCAITKACVYDPEVQRAYGDCAEGYGFKIDPCPPRDPQKKGIVEAGVKYIKRSFLPLRGFRGLSDGNRQLQEWVMSEAGNRRHGTTREAPLTRFVEVEQSLLTPLPDIPPELATWMKLKLHRDAHVQFQNSYYSAPFALIGQMLWLKATDAMVTLYQTHQVVASHVRAKQPGQRQTVADHMPPAAQAWQMQDVQWCLTQAEQVGVACHALVRALFGDKVLIKLRSVQGVLRLKQKYGSARLEAACSRANHFTSQSYGAVKAILQKGLDQQSMLTGFDELAATYTEGGRFYRDTSTILQ